MNNVKRTRKNKDLLIQGERIYLRKLKVLDVNKKYLKWMNDPEVNKFIESRFIKWSYDKLRKYVQKINVDPDNFFLAIILTDTGEHIGNIKLGPINRIHRFADLGIIIGKKEFWGQGLASEAIKLVTDFSFNRLRLHKLTAGVYSNNVGSIKAFKKCGFLVEGMLKNQYLCNGNYVDGTLLGIIKK